MTIISREPEPFITLSVVSKTCNAAVKTTKRAALLYAIPIGLTAGVVVVAAAYDIADRLWGVGLEWLFPILTASACFALFSALRADRANREWRRRCEQIRRQD